MEALWSEVTLTKVNIQLGIGMSRFSRCIVLIAFCFVGSIFASRKCFFNNLSTNAAQTTVKAGSYILNIFDENSNAKLLDKIDEGVAYRLRKTSPEVTGMDIVNYTIVGEPVPIPPKSQHLLASLLNSHNSYSWGVLRGCSPSYGLQTQFKNEGEILDIFICFECNMLAIYKNKKLVGLTYFDPIRSKLIALSKELFPNDSEINSLDSLLGGIGHWLRSRQ